ncbi:hypothetical protein [Ensifer adhaerens]|uniref:hypothetical protein n=1 Tax=Ensifer adhaerens TaxID=106592 RepID=UPI003F86E6B4
MDLHSFVDRDELVAKVINGDCRSYLSEAIDCYEVGAYRAALVMLCCAVFEDIRLKAKDYAPFDGWAEKVSNLIEAKLDKQNSYESNVLENVESAKHFFSPAQRVCLRKILDARNRAAHPSGVETNQLEVVSLIRDGVEHFLSVRALLGEKGIDVLIKNLEQLELFPESGSKKYPDIALQLLDGIDPRAHINIVQRIVPALLKGCTDKFRRNAIGFLECLAAAEIDTGPRALAISLAQTRTLPPTETWLMDVVKAGPALLKEVSGRPRIALDAALASMVVAVPERDDERVFFLAEMYSSVLGKIGPTKFVQDYPRTFDSLVSRIWWHPQTAKSLAYGEPLRRRVVSAIFEQIDVPERAGHFASVTRYTRSETVLAQHMTDLEAFTMIAQFAQAGFSGNALCRGLLQTRFDEFPALRAKALAVITSDEPSAVSILGSYAGNFSVASFVDQLTEA